MIKNAKRNTCLKMQKEQRFIIMQKETHVSKEGFAPQPRHAPHPMNLAPI
jgi:hypothetical protein